MERITELVLKVLFTNFVDNGIVKISLASVAITALLAFGTFQVVQEFINLPSKKARKAVLSMTRAKTGMVDQLTTPVANILSRYIRLDPDRRSSLQRKLYSAEINYSPEFYSAKALSESALITLLAIPVCFLFPLLSVVVVALGIAVYFLRMEELDHIIRKKTEKIDGELVLFANTIKQQLSTSRDVMKILQSYRKVCGEEFTHELDMTIADMKTGNYEKALRNLELRIPSVELSEIIRGLLAVMRGDDQRGYFEMLTHDLTVKSKEELKRAAIKRPEKLKPAAAALLVSFLAMYVYVIIYIIVDQLPKLFG